MADAYRGKEMRLALLDFFAAASSHNRGEWSAPGNATKIATGGAADLVAYVGHNGLMDFRMDLPKAPNGKGTRDAIVLCCRSDSYFSDPLRRVGARPLLTTAGLMAPEAYSLKAALDGWILAESPEKVRERAAQAYHRNQDCGLRAARWLFGVK